MNLGIGGKTALVLGGGGGLGSAIAAALAAEGARVVIADIALQSVERVCAELQAKRLEAHPLHWDLADLGSIDAKVLSVEQAVGPVDILVNNTGGPPPSSATSPGMELWLQHFNAMVLSVIATTNRVLPGMRDRKWGRIITSTSSGVVAPIPNLALSNALRMTLLGWSKTLAREVGGDGVTVNVLVPGRIATARIEALDRAKAARESRPLSDVVRDSVESIPVGRYGQPSEYGDAAAFLASQNASYITGAMMRVDGGMISSF